MIINHRDRTWLETFMAQRLWLTLCFSFLALRRKKQTHGKNNKPLSLRYEPTCVKMSGSCELSDEYYMRRALEAAEEAKQLGAFVFKIRGFFLCVSGR